jgi:hypothetical protein
VRINFLVKSLGVWMAEPLGLAREAWGPRFWKILHTLAETSGSQRQVILNNDEADAWIILLKAQQFVMPCALCKDHYKQWRLSHSTEPVRKLSGEDRKDFLRRWLWGCHDRVNQTNNKESVSIEELPSLYPKQSIQKELNELNTMFQLAITRQTLKYEEVKVWKAVIQRLRLLVGV